MKLSSKLTLGILLAFLIGTIVSLIGFGAARDINSNFTIITEESLPELIELERIARYGEMLQAEAVSYALISQLEGEVTEKMESEAKEFYTTKTALDLAIASLNAVEYEGEEPNDALSERQLVKRIEKTTEELYKASLNLIKASEAQSADMILANRKEILEEVEDKFQNIVFQGIEDEIEEIKFRKEHAKKASTKARWRIIIASLVALVCIVGYGRFISRSISRTVVELGEAIKLIGQGDFGQIIRGEKGDELGDLSKRFDKMAINLNNKINELKDEAYLEGRESVGERLHKALNELMSVKAQLENKIEETSNMSEVLKQREEKIAALEEEIKRRKKDS